MTLECSCGDTHTHTQTHTQTPQTHFFIFQTPTFTDDNSESLHVKFTA
jgi:hypothetical protein